MRIDQQPTYLLHARPYRETSLLLEIFSRDHGRIGLIARGIRSSRRHAQRAQLQPGRPLLLGWRDVGDLPLLANIDSGPSTPRIEGDGVLSMLYVNELLIRLLPRREAQSALFDRYAWLLSRLGDDRDSAAALRRFEAMLLACCGYALMLEADADGLPIDSLSNYRYHPEEGARRLQPGVAIRPGDVPGAALIALRDESPLRSAWLGSLRRLLQERIREQLGDRPLQSWRLRSMLSRSDKGQSSSAPTQDDP